MRLIHQDLEVQDPGQTGGDYVGGREFSRRATWETGDPDQPYLTVEVTAYTEIVECDENFEDSYYAGEEALELPNLDATEDVETKPGRYHTLVETARTDVIYHTDPDDPGSSETGISEVEYEGIGFYTHDNLEDSQEFCRDYIASLTFEDDGTVR